MRLRHIHAINNMRLEGKTPIQMAELLGLPVNTIRSHIRRHPEIPGTIRCQNCGRAIPQAKGRRVKKFCCDRCRMAWWNDQYRHGGKHHEEAG